MDNKNSTYLVLTVSGIMPKVKEVCNKTNDITPLRKLKWHGWILAYLAKHYFDTSLRVNNDIFKLSYVSSVSNIASRINRYHHNMNIR